MAALPFPAQAKDGPPGPDGLPVANPKHPWNTFTGTPREDTLSFRPSDVLPVARRQIENDQWEVFTLDAGRGTIVTRWKAMHLAPNALPGAERRTAIATCRDTCSSTAADSGNTRKRCGTPIP